MAKKSTFKSNWPKYLLQWGVLALLVFFLSGRAWRGLKAKKETAPGKKSPVRGQGGVGT